MLEAIEDMQKKLDELRRLAKWRVPMPAVTLGEALANLRLMRPDEMISLEIKIHGHTNEEPTVEFTTWAAGKHLRAGNLADLLEKVRVESVSATSPLNLVECLIK